MQRTNVFGVAAVTCLLAAWAATTLLAQGARSPREALGYELGERYTPHAAVVAYLRGLAADSDRVALASYGSTSERRELLLLFLTSPENHARLDELRRRMARLADPRTLAEGENVEDLVRDLPVFVWLSYDVHGNETSCTEAALRTVYELASGGDDVRALLDEAVVIVDPCVNPDGRDRYVNWFNSVAGKRGDPNPQSIEHDEPWPGGRYNHYYFDLNRDWAFMTQIETRRRIAEFVKWTPQVHVDFHEMGSESSYFFFPADRPINDNFPPYTTKWGEVFGRGNAAAFDARGWDYYTAEDFDLFYPGYGDSWPSLHGAIGMTYEQAGHGAAGIVVRRRDETLLTLKDRLEHHFVASMATIRTAVANRAKLLRDFHGFRRSAIEEGRGGAVREFLLVPGRDPERTGHLVDLLVTQGVEVRRARAGFSARGVTDFLGRRHEERAFTAGTYLISLAQPAKRLVKTLLEPRTRIKELYFYDVAAWSLPLAYGVEAFWTGQPAAVESEAVTSAPAPVGAVEDGEAAYGYLVGWETMSAVRAAVRLTAAGLRVKSAREAFTLDGREWDRGTLVVPRGAAGSKLEDTLRAIASETGVRFVPARTGMTEKGIDLGSDKMIRLRSPRVALIGGEGIGATSYGATRYVLEELYDIPYSSFALSSLARLDLKDFTAVVLPAGSGRLEEPAQRTLDRFVRRGGVVVAVGRSARGLSREGVGFAKASTAYPGKQKKEERKKTIEERDAERRRRSTPGSIFRVELDPAHPLAFGYGGEITVFQRGMLSFDPKSASTPVAWFLDAPPLSGYILEETEKKLRGRAYALVERKGRGAVVLIAGDPNFRSVWHGLTRLFLNAVLLLPRS